MSGTGRRVVCGRYRRRNWHISHKEYSMHRFLLGLLLPLVLLAALWAQGRPEKQKPTTAAGEYKALMDEYVKALKESDLVFEKAKNDEERQKVRTEFAKFRSKLIGRVLTFAQTHPKDKEALLALFFVIHLDTNAERGDVDLAVQLVLKDHIASERLNDPPILQFIVFQDFQAAEKLLRGVLEKSPHQAMQAQACLGLAQIIKEKAGASPPAEAIKLTEEAEQLFERVMNKYADVKDAAEKAKVELFETRHLALGKTMPDIQGKDSAGKELKLSDYRG